MSGMTRRGVPTDAIEAAAAADPVPSPGRLVQGRIYRDGALGRRPPVPVEPAHLAVAASRRMGRRGWAYVAGSAGQQRTARANETAFERYRLVPRMLRDVAVRDLSVDLLGRRLTSPFLLAPVGVLGVAHRDADVAVARGAAAVGVPMVISTQASRPMEEIAAALGATPRWFQLYWSRDEELVTSFVRRAEAIGVDAIVVTLDTHTLGWRPWDLDLGSLPFARGEGLAQYTSDPVFQARVRDRAASAPAGPDPLGPPPRPGPAAVATLLSLAGHHPGGRRENLRSPLPRAAVQTFLDVFSNPSLTWADLASLRARTSLPIVLKGLQHPDDARLALEHGVDAIVVSNHGGRQVDGAIASLDALPPIAAEVAGRIPVLFDSGIRSGADALIALALGADAVLVGRPYVYGLALAGQAGVEAVLRNLVAELDLTLGLVGCRTLADLRQTELVRS
jgi:isopentenyl diphosphate isomerase/L-lactate dehydrogenase-like FMN-dependent dehydrogenase